MNLNTVLRDLPLSPPVTVEPAHTLRQALHAIDAVGADAAVVVDPGSEVPLGVITLRGVLRGIVADAGVLDEPVAAVMTGGLASLNASATVHEATVLMFRKGMRRLILTGPDGRLFNIVSQGDLYGMQAADSAKLANAILAARTLDEIAAKAVEVRRFAVRRLAEGAGAQVLCEWLSALNDLITLQVIDLVEGDYELPYVPWAWMVFGSEGRFEQTLVTDQDNGIIFVADPASAADELRQCFLPFARAVNSALDRCGFPFCKGEIMAGNPSWCLSLDEWQRKFHHWIAVPDPQSLLNATIFFDFRSLHGGEDPAMELRRWLRGHLRGNSAFFQALARNALEQEAPLNWLGGFRFEANRQYPKTLDLKSQGIRLFVDAARVAALANGVEPTNTVERLRSVRMALGLPVGEEAALAAAFYQIQRLRLQNQIAGDFPEAANRLDPRRLHELDRHILKETFRQARKLQQRIRLDYLPQ